MVFKQLSNKHIHVSLNHLHTNIEWATNFYELQKIEIKEIHSTTHSIAFHLNDFQDDLFHEWMENGIIVESRQPNQKCLYLIECYWSDWA